mgnify:CR=1 FL=1
MIASAIPGDRELLIVAQADHARFAAELLALWRTDGLPGHPRRKELLFAVGEHDNGWRELDSAPTVDPATGGPMDFLGAPVATKVEVWRRGTARFAGEHPYAAALIAQHALRLFGAERHDERWRRLLEWIEDRQREWLAAAGEEATAIGSDDAWLDRVDRISLLACGVRGVQPTAGVALATAWDPDSNQPVQVQVDPFPLAGATTFRIPCRRIAARPFHSDADLAGELAAAPWRTFSVQVTEAIKTFP